MRLNGGFPKLLVDPPWQYDNDQDHDPARGGTPYKQMSIQDLCAMRPLIDKVVGKDCTMLLWGTRPKQEQAFQLLDAWGFPFVTQVFTWVKLNKNGELLQPDSRWNVGRDAAPPGEGFVGSLNSKDVVIKGGVRSGQGYWTNGQTEFVLMGKRGHPKRYAKDVKEVIFAPIGDIHSSKPEEVRERIDRVWGPIPGLELFARPPKVKGWLKLGYEVDGMDIRDSLAKLIGVDNA